MRKNPSLAAQRSCVLYFHSRLTLTTFSRITRPYHNYKLCLMKDWRAHKSERRLWRTAGGLLSHLKVPDFPGTLIEGWHDGPRPTIIEVWYGCFWHWLVHLHVTNNMVDFFRTRPEAAVVSWLWSNPTPAKLTPVHLLNFKGHRRETNNNWKMVSPLWGYLASIAREA